MLLCLLNCKSGDSVILCLYKESLQEAGQKNDAVAGEEKEERALHLEDTTFMLMIEVQSLCIT